MALLAPLENDSIMPTRRIAIVGAFGIGSIGDEAGLDAFIDLVADFAVVTVLMRNPTESYARAHSVLVAPKLEHKSRADGQRLAFRGMNGEDGPEPIEEVLRVFSEQDLVVLGPGDFLNEDTGQFMRGALPEMALMAWLAEMAGTPYMVFAASSRRLAAPWAIAQAGYVLSHAAAVTLRDPLSRELLVESGIRGAERAIVIRDPVRATQCMRQEAVKDRLGLSVRYVGYQGPEMAERYAAIVEYVTIQHQGEVYSIPMFASGCGYQDDREMALQLAPGATHVESISLTPGEAMGLWSTCERALVTRLHAAVMCYSLGVPFVALAYEPKVSGFCTSVGARWFPLTADPQEVADALYAAERIPPSSPDLGPYRSAVLAAING